MRSSARARLIVETGYILRSVTEQGNALFRERRDNKFARRSPFEDFSRLRVDDLRQEMILREMKSFAAVAFARNSGAAKFAHSVVIR